jgi:hypothetical protein
MSIIRVYIDDHCIGCRRAKELVERAQAARRDVDIQAVEVDGEAEIPESLFALPTWYTGGQIWKLGNPSWDELTAILSAEATTPDDSPDN